MRIRARTLAPAAAAALIAAGCGGGEPRQEVEVLGPPGTTRAALEDSLARYRPDVELASAACAVVLRDSVGYPDAAVERRSVRNLLPWEPDRETVIVSVVGPADSTHVRFRPRPSARPDIARWEEGLELVRTHRAAPAAFGRPAFLRGEASGATPAGAGELRAWVAARDGPGDWRTASRTLASDGSRDHRTLATLVLTNFPRRDSTYYLLADALRLRIGPPTGLAELVLRGLARVHGRRVDWRPARPVLDALLGGTNLLAFETVLEVLRRTRIETELARELVRSNPHVFRARLGSRHAFVRRPVVRFLRTTIGGERGEDPEAWRRWLAEEG